MQEKLTILIDMDNTIVNWDLALYDQVELDHCERDIDWCIFKCFPYHVDEIKKVIEKPLFYQNLPVMDEHMTSTLNRLRERHIVKICTSPPVGLLHTFTEKAKWVAAHLGEEWVKDLICTTDKTMIYADFLIDDKPVITGCIVPMWKHVHYSQPYNVRFQLANRVISSWNYEHVHDVLQKIDLNK